MVLRELKCKLGEKEIDSINAVEDTKGNNGERGKETLSFAGCDEGL